MRQVRELLGYFEISNELLAYIFSIQYGGKPNSHKVVISRMLNGRRTGNKKFDEIFWKFIFYIQQVYKGKANLENLEKIKSNAYQLLSYEKDSKNKAYYPIGDDNSAIMAKSVYKDSRPVDFEGEDREKLEKEIKNFYRKRYEELKEEGDPLADRFVNFVSNL